MKMAGGVTRWFLYDEAGTSQTPLIEESFSSGTTTVTAANGFGADGWRARVLPTRSTLRGWFYTFDPQGNQVQRTTPDMLSVFNPSVQVYSTSLYDAYGLSKEYQAFNGVSPAAIRDPVGFGGQWGYYTDFETAPSGTTSGLILLTHRYYDPSTGRFINRDPIGYQGGINLYNFAGGNPVNEIDPSGTNPILQWLANSPVGQWVATQGGRVAQTVMQRAAPLWQRGMGAIQQRFGTWGQWFQKQRANPPAQSYLSNKIVRDANQRLTNGVYTVSSEKMGIHVSGKSADIAKGKSQFLFRIDPEVTVLRAAEFADKYNLWNSENKAKVPFTHPVGVLGKNGELTNYVNVYRTVSGFLHGAPGSPPTP